MFASIAIREMRTIAVHASNSQACIRSCEFQFNTVLLRTIDNSLDEPVVDRDIGNSIQFVAIVFASLSSLRIELRFQQGNKRIHAFVFLF